MVVSGCGGRARSFSAETFRSRSNNSFGRRRGFRSLTCSGQKPGALPGNLSPLGTLSVKKDHTVHPDLERAMAKRMGATVYELDSSHVPMLSQPERVLEVIRTAASAVEQATAA